jgi:hypothetical protein
MKSSQEDVVNFLSKYVIGKAVNTEDEDWDF